MPFSRLSIEQIENFQPAVDYRKAGAFGVIAGRNFSWDAAGVRSDFASRLIAGVQSIANYGDHVQSVKVGAEYHIICRSRVWRFVPVAPDSSNGSWTLLTTLDEVQTVDHSAIPEHLRNFTSFDMGGYAYVNSWNNGCYRVNLQTHVYTRLTSVNTPGFPADNNPVYAIAETSGVAVYMTRTSLHWSGPAQPEDLVPTIGGAGFQLIAQKVSGTPKSLLRVDRGVILWTTTGAMAAEYVGAPYVFRFYQFASNITPLNQSAMTQLPDGTSLALTQLGLYRISDFGAPTLINPLFAEFFREYIRKKLPESATIWYSLPDNRLFVAMRLAGSQFSETFCLDINIDKWGVMNHLHVGIIQYVAGTRQLGYVDSSGISSYFLSPLDVKKDIENSAAPLTYRGLDSYVTIGYFRIENMLNGGEGLQTLTGLMVYRNSTAGMYADSLIDEGQITDPAVTLVDEGLITTTPFDEIDEGLIDSTSVIQGYKVDFLSDFNGVDVITGIDYSVSPAYLAKESENSDWWTGEILGHYLSVRISANEVGEFYRIKSLDLTMSFSGEIGG